MEQDIVWKNDNDYRIIGIQLKAKVGNMFVQESVNCSCSQIDEEEQSLELMLECPIHKERGILDLVQEQWIPTEW